MAKKKDKKKSSQQKFLSPEAFLRQRMRSLPIGKCYINDMVDASGLCHIIVTREHTGGRVSAGMFLVDMWCTGVREAFYRLRIEPEELDELMFRDHDLIDFREISYEEAHNRIYGAIAFAEEAGLKPDKSFQTAQYLLEEDTDDVPLMEFEFGKDGEYFLVCESQLEASRYLPTLRRTLGEDGFKYIVGLYDDDDDDDDDDGDDDGRVLISDSPVTVADLVGCMDISEVQNCADVLGIDLDEEQPEDAQLQAYAEAVVKHPELVLDHVSEEDLERLHELCDIPDWGDYLPYFDSGTDSLLVDYGLAEQGWKEDSTLYAVHVAADFLKSAKPLIADYMKKEKPGLKLRYVVEMVTDGLANLYGMVTRRQVADYIKKHILTIPSDYADDIFDDAWANSMLIDKMVQPVLDYDPAKGKLQKENVVFMSRYGWSDVRMQQHIINKMGRHVSEYRSFTLDEVADAARGGVPLITNARQADLERFLTDVLGHNEMLVMVICHNLWYYQQHIGDPVYEADKTPDAFFKEMVLGKHGGQLTETQKDEGMRLLYDYLDHMPQWVMKGFSRI